jgi:hypothetical protein
MNEQEEAPSFDSEGWGDVVQTISIVFTRLKLYKNGSILRPVETLREGAHLSIQRSGWSDLLNFPAAALK